MGTYVVKAGDRLRSLADGFGVQIIDLLDANKQLKGRPYSAEGLPVIRPGDVLNVPGARGPDPTAVVVPGTDAFRRRPGPVIRPQPAGGTEGRSYGLVIALLVAGALGYYFYTK